jgi:photosystem II stability/assembly factor-like uncharacterized protein
MRMRVGWLGGVVAVSVSLASAPALANGRYPNADMLIVDSERPNRLVLRATFGTLVSVDEGRNWFWICEEAIGYMGDPALTVLAGGNLLHAFLGSVTVSAAEGCSFNAVPFDAEGRLAIDVTLDPLDPSHAWVLATGMNGRRQASVLDASATAVSLVSAADDFVPSTIEVSRSRPERMYVVGFDGGFRSTLLISDDRGQSWSPRPIHPYPELPMYLSAVDPVDPDTLYIRVDGGSSDHLIVSRDAGKSYVDVLTIATDMLGFALSPDGSRVAAGGPGAGLQVARTTDLSFSPAADIVSLRCLTWAERGLFACAQESLDGWTLALSTDQGQTFAPLWHVQDLVPLECAASTSTGSVCPRAWLDVSAQLGADLVPGGIPYVGGPRAAPTAPSTDGSSCSVAMGRSSQGARLGLGAVLLGLVGAALRRRSPSLDAVG